MRSNEIDHVAIYPPIGISRIGNSTTEYFLASEQPGVSVVPPGGYKDKEGRIKKEVTRFRIYAFNAEGEVIRELTAKEARIEWRVEVANLKPAWYEFNNALDLGPKYGIPSIRRNSEVVGGYREQLAIKPSPKSIYGIDTKGEDYHFDDGKFYGKNVDLGHIETDSEGRLLFFAGDGGAESHNNVPITTFANNEGWHDDTCDGVVRATVSIDKKSYNATPAMIAVTPPNYGQGLYGVVTMNDVVQNLFIQEMDYPNPSKHGVEFWRDVYPIFERMTNTQWVNEGFNMLFGKNSPSDFTDPRIVDLLKDPSAKSAEFRERVFAWFRNPRADEYSPKEIPPFYGDGFNDYQGISLDDLSVTVVQYDRLCRWKSGDFIVGEPRKVIPFDKLTLPEQIDALKQAPLDNCLGGPFHPGIELTWTMRVKSMWESAYRLKTVPEGDSIPLDFGDVLTSEIALSPNGPCSINGPGSLTRWMGVPWQTDEASCLSGYTVSTYLPLPSFWAARVPNQVFVEDSYERIQAGHVNIAQRLKHLDYRQDWLRDIEADHLKRLTNMVNEWEHLGIMTKQEKVVPNNEDGYLPTIAWVEMGRNFTEEEPDQTLAQVLYAEGDINNIHTDKAFVGSKSRMVDSLDHALKTTMELKSDAPKSNRKRRTLDRGER
ncbi:MAG: LodA/GoxA family CTQ-dependent oxidase [Crocinitomicaceae bacterium]|nr:LodA/GoxA family CTQ-dependent oxidase [Crocinitomicaceae bacterium]